MNLASFRRRIRFIRRLLTVVLLFFFTVIASMAFVNIDERYYASGVIRPKLVYSVFASANAFVKEQTVDEGAFVHEGDLLYRLDDWDLRKRKVELDNERRELAAQIKLQEVNVARATDDTLPQWLRTPEIDVGQSQKQVDERQREVDRLEKLIDQGAASELEVDRARLELQASLAEQQRNQKKQELMDEGFAERAVAAAQAQADILRARLQSIDADEEALQEDFARREIRAPVASTVTLAMSDLGEPVKEGQEMMHLYSGEEI
ncbi:MAG: hypothetical protein NTW86_31465, partial [Candidatus Sumerlaeota bacterium]|nr:hypothetical protein [Candidatus Sumerlaeota bacterium]